MMIGKSLQCKFTESRGEPVRQGEYTVKQLDSIKIESGTYEITVSFLDGKNNDVGIHLEAPDGWIELSDNTQTHKLAIWRGIGLPDVIKHQVYCPNGEIVMWNIYRIRHSENFVTEDKWTGNAGLIIIDEGKQKKQYGCSSGPGEFNPFELIVEIAWRHVVPT